MTPALDRTRAVLDQPAPDPIPGQLHLEHPMTEQTITPATSVRLDDGSTHTMQAITDAGEHCVQHECTSAREENRLRQQLYVLRAKVDDVLDQVTDLMADDDTSKDALGRLRQDLRDALGLDTP